MKIVILGPAHPYRGGIAALNERLAIQFIREGHEVTIFNFKLQYPDFLFPGNPIHRRCCSGKYSECTESKFCESYKLAFGRERAEKMSTGFTNCKVLVAFYGSGFRHDLPDCP